MFGANVLMLVYGDAFWPTYATGDNTGLVATDSMKNFIQRETLAFNGQGLEDYCRFLGEKFLGLYPQVEGVQVTAIEIPYRGLEARSALVPSGPEQRAGAHRAESRRHGRDHVGHPRISAAAPGWQRLLGFVRDEYTTLPDIRNRPLHMWLDLEWRYTSPAAGLHGWAHRRRRRGASSPTCFSHSNRAASSR